MILVTKKDGSTAAINVDRIERVEANDISKAHESNVFLVGGGLLVVMESPDTIFDRIVDAKARVLARSAAFAAVEHESVRTREEREETILRVVPHEVTEQ